MQQMAADGSAEANRLGHHLEVKFAEGDSMLQVRQILEATTAARDLRPDAILVMPVQEGSVFALSRRVLESQIGCVFLNRIKGSVAKLQGDFPHLPVGLIAPDQKEAGRIQARQLVALLPDGGNAICVNGRVTNSSAEARIAGFNEILGGSKVRQVAMLPGNWTAVETEKVLGEWLVATRPRWPCTPSPATATSWPRARCGLSPPCARSSIKPGCWCWAATGCRAAGSAWSRAARWPPPRCSP
jgi:ABC-type sugar transport system substrate-binding protein